MRRIALCLDPRDPCDHLFGHGVALALHNHVELDLVHVHPPGQPGAFHGLPGLRTLLVRWGHLREEAPPDALGSLRMRVVLEAIEGEEPAALAGEELRQMRPDLLLVGTHRRRGLAALLHGSVGAAIARRAKAPTLFLGLGEPGFLDLATGELRLRRMLVPVGQDLDLDQAVEHCAAWLPRLGAGPFEIRLVHIGAPLTSPVPAPPPGLQARIELHSRNEGDLVAGVLAAAQEGASDLILMASHGRDSWLDALVGSKTEELIRWTDRPVLVLPISG